MQNIDHTVTPSRTGVFLIKMAIVYLLLGLLLGLGMAISGQYQLSSIHTHINLLGWVTLALAGILYCLFPQVGATRMALWHARMHNLGLPIMMISLTLYHLGYGAIKPVLGVSSLVTAAGLMLFAANLLTQLGTQKVGVMQTAKPSIQTNT